MKLNENQTSEMIRTAAQKPRDRKDFILNMMNQRAMFNKEPVVQVIGPK